MFYQQIFVLIKLIYKLLNGFSIAVLASVFESEISGGEGGQPNKEDMAVTLACSLHLLKVLTLCTYYEPVQLEL